MTAPPEGAQRSEDGNYWWDDQAQQWQPVDQSQPSSSSSDSSTGGSQEQPLDWSQFPTLWMIMGFQDVPSHYQMIGIDPASLEASGEEQPV